MPDPVSTDPNPAMHFFPSPLPFAARSRRRLAALLAAGCCAMASPGAQAQDTWPAKPIKLIVPSAPGGGVDTVARIWANCAATRIGQPLVIENRAGANGLPAVQALKQAPADGYTLFIAGMSQLTITPYVYAKPPYEVARDFEGVSLVVSSPYLLVASPGSKIDRFADIGKAAAAAPAGLNFGSPGTGSPAHLMSAILADKLKAALVHVPFQGEATALTSVVGNQIDLAPFIAGTALGNVKAGKIKALAVLGSARLADLPTVPTVAELLGSAELAHGSWTALMARSGTPAAVVQKLHAATQQCLQEPDVVQRYQGMHAVTLPGTRADVADYIRRDTDVWKPLVARLGVRND